ncbi:cell division protein ZapA, partial [bacterium]|nr:cell division protein ZapA [bacterium]
PPQDKAGLIEAAKLLNNQIESIPDKSNALILASLDLAFQNQIPQETENAHVVSKETEKNIQNLISKIERSLN